MAKLGEMLLAEGLLSADQLQGALAVQARDGGFLGSILVSHGMISEVQLAEVLSRQAGAPQVDLETVPVDPKLVRLLAEPLARKHLCVPVKLNGQVLHVAMADPTDADAIEQLSFRTGKTVKALVAGPTAIERAWARLYGDGAAAAEAFANLDKVLSSAIDDVKVLDQKAEEKASDLKVGADDPPVIKLVNAILLKAVEMGASDIHMEPLEDGYRVRYRIDGVLHPVMELPAAVRMNVASRIKIVSHMDIAERRLPQDGRLMISLGAKGNYDFRVSCLPAIHGEKIVIRILGQGSLKGAVAELGFRGKALADVENAIQNPYGMVLVTGPTGSGKTTTLYTMLSVLNQPDVNIVTAEDPVEYHIKGITQVAVKPHIGYTFDMALRAFLRQDPDVILVGEMRDYETAAIAVKAALTGHLVLSTLHTNDAPSTVVRLVDMGIEPYLVSSAVKLVIAQRLVRRICTSCKEEVRMSEADRQNLAESTAGAIERVYRGKGCDSCNKIGYRGRLPVFEVMPIRSREMKRIITEGGTEVQVAQVARKEDLRSLKDDVIDLLNSGETTMEEAFSILLSE
jgi:type IV pilus assembly protein PilB